MILLDPGVSFARETQPSGVAFVRGDTCARNAWPAFDFDSAQKEAAPDRFGRSRFGIYGALHRPGAAPGAQDSPQNEALLLAQQHRLVRARSPPGIRRRNFGFRLGDRPSAMPCSGRVARRLRVGLHLRFLRFVYNNQRALSFVPERTAPNSVPPGMSALRLSDQPCARPNATREGVAMPTRP